MLLDTKQEFDAAEGEEVRTMADQPAVQAPVPFVGGPFPTIRASQTAVFVDGGAFVLTLIERRPLPNVPGPPALGDFEVGRLILPPTALLQLRANIDAALQDYRAFFGSEPPGPEQLPTDAMDAARRSLLGNLPVQPPNTFSINCDVR